MAYKRAALLLLFAIAAAFTVLAGCSAQLSEQPSAIETPAPSPSPTPKPVPTLINAPSPDRRAARPNEARELSDSMTVFIDGQSSTDWLTDNDYTTVLSLPAGTEIVLQFDSEISGLYMIWNTTPGEWAVNTGSYLSYYGERGFLHEFAELPEATDSVTITLVQGGDLCDIHAFTDGLLPDSVQIWKESVERADILLLPTHGDDELLFFGGIIPYYAGELGLSVQVAYLISHDVEPIRPHEQLDGLWTAGLTAYPVFGVFADHNCGSLKEASAFYDIDDIIQYQVEIIRRFQPQVIVCHDEDGEYGHGAHALNSYCIKRAVKAANDRSYDSGSLERYGTWNAAKLYLHLRWINCMFLDYDQPLERFGGRTAFQVAEEAFAKHVSQQNPFFYVYPHGHTYDSTRFGLFHSTVGQDVEKNDLMEHLTPYEISRD